MRCALKMGLVLVVILLMGLTSSVNAATSLPREQLKQTIDQILEVLRDSSLQTEDKKIQRREMVRQIARVRFDYRKMSQLSLGKHWKGITDQEKNDFVDLFGTLLENTYMAKIETYTNEKVVFLKDRVKKKKAQVNTKIITKSVEIPIDYRMYRKKENLWMVYDMVIEGVSMIGNYRSQFSQMLERGSFESLMAKLKEKQNKTE